MTAIRFAHVSFTHPSSSIPLFADLTFHAAAGWMGIIGPNGSGKTTLLSLAHGALQPQSGTVFRQGTTVFCPQRTDEPPERWPEFLEAGDADAGRLRALLGIADDWADRWPTLSHGERKRAQIGEALWQDPDILLIDEPTNHLDQDAMRVLREALSGFRGTGLLVSHDRDLLDALCDACLFLSPPSAELYPGNYTAAGEQKRRRELGIERERASLTQEIHRLGLEAKRRQHEARMADRKKSRRHLSRHDSDGRGRIGLAILTGKDAVAGTLARQMQARIERKREELARLEVRKEYDHAFWMPAAVSSRNTLFRVEAGSLPLGEHARLVFPDLLMGPTDRLALMGPNGAGKTVFLRHALERANVPPERLIYVPQEIPLAQARQILAEVRSLAKRELGIVFSVVSCLGSRPERLLQTDQPSPGEIRKLLLALGIAREPHLIALDEPTNHLDLTAIELLEDALAGCPCGLLLVSHDRRFLERLTTTRWLIAGTGAERRLEPASMDATAG